MVCTVLDFLQMYVMAALAPHHIMLSGGWGWGWGCVHKALWITDTLCSVGADLALTSFLTLSIPSHCCTSSSAKLVKIVQAVCADKLVLRPLEVSVQEVPETVPGMCDR